MFYAKTTNSVKFKALFEILFQNVTTICFAIDSNGMRSKNLTNQNTTIIVDLPAGCFDEYKFDNDEPLYIGLGSHVNQFLKSIKNKTYITLSITTPFVLDISIVSKVDDHVVSLSSSIESVQNIALFHTHTYTCKPVEINSSTFNHVCKWFKAPTLMVTKKTGQLLFSFEIVGISTKTISFNKRNDEDKELFAKYFKSDQFMRIAKLSSFVDDTVRIYAEEHQPLCIDAVSSIGRVHVYLMGTDDN